MGVTGGDPGSGGVDPRGFESDRALTRLEDVLDALPFDRALPELTEILARAEVPRALLRGDERFLKVLHEAAVARPFGQLAHVVRTRTEVELCTLEVEVLTDRLVEDAGEPEVRARAAERLATIRTRLDELRAQL